MNMWDDLMSSFTFPPDQSHNNHSNQSNQNSGQPTSYSNPHSPASVTHNNINGYTTMSPSSSSNGLDARRRNGQRGIHPIQTTSRQPPPTTTHFTRSNSTKDLQQQQQFGIHNNPGGGTPVDLTSQVPSPVPYMRPRVYTWGASSTGQIPVAAVAPAPVLKPTSSAGNNRQMQAESMNRSNISPTAYSGQNQHHNGSSFKASNPVVTPVVDEESMHDGPAAKRRATCPDSMRSYRRGRKTGGVGTTPTVKFSIKPEHPHQPQQFHMKMEDVDSDISEDEYQRNGNGFYSSGNASSASDASYESRLGQVELLLLRQPESHHRARYQKEGSRGCIKDRTGNSCPAVQLAHYSGPAALLQAFIATESGTVRAHPLYRVCKVGGKHSTPCRERVLDSGITALEMDLTRDNNYMLNVDCLGIMKLRNADFEQVFDAEDLAKRRKRSPKVRLVFRAVFVVSHSQSATLQVVSTPICCTPSPGVPEIHFISHASCQATGGIDIVIIGRNFVKDDSRLFVVEQNADDIILWEREVSLLPENFNTVHLVGQIPAYKDVHVPHPVELNLYVRNKGGKQSEPYKFTYLPDAAAVRNAASPAQARSPAAGNSTPSTPGYQQQGRSTPNHPLSRVQSSSAVNPYVGVLESSQPPPGVPVIQIPQQYLNMQQEAGQNLQYCIQLPGSSQPIIITIPQSNSEASLYNQEGALQSPKQEPLMDYPGYGMMANQAPPDGRQFQQPPLMQQDSGCGNMTAGNDEDLFNELLKEILGAGEQQAEQQMISEFSDQRHGGAVGSPAGGAAGGMANFMNAYQSPVQSPQSLAALSCSLNSMEVNRPIRNDGVGNFLLEEDQDNFMS